MVEACPEETVRSFLTQGGHPGMFIWTFPLTSCPADEEFAKRENDNQKDDEKVALDSEQTIKELRTECAESQQRIDSLTRVLQAHHRKHQCEILFSDGQVFDAAKSLLEITRSVSDDAVKADMIIMDWLSGEPGQCE